MNELLNNLKDIGLSKKAARLYLELVKVRRVTVAELFKLTKIARSTIYINLNKLVDLGLASEQIIGRKRFFFAKEVNSFSQLLNKQNESVEAFIKDLEQDNNEQECEPAVQVFSIGKNGLEKGWNKTVQSKEKLLRELGLYEIWRTYIMDLVGSKKHEVKMIRKWNSNRVKIRTMSSRQDTDNFLADEDYPPDYYVEIYDEKQVEQRLCPGSLHFRSAMTILDDILKVYLPPSDGLLVFVKSESIFDTFKTLYDVLWEKAELNNDLTQERKRHMTIDR